MTKYVPLKSVVKLLNDLQHIPSEHYRNITPEDIKRAKKTVMGLRAIVKAEGEKDYEL